MCVPFHMLLCNCVVNRIRKLSLKASAHTAIKTFCALVYVFVAKQCFFLCVMINEIKRKTTKDNINNNKTTTSFTSMILGKMSEKKNKHSAKYLTLALVSAMHSAFLFFSAQASKKIENCHESKRKTLLRFFLFIRIFTTQRATGCC